MFEFVLEVLMNLNDLRKITAFDNDRDVKEEQRYTAYKAAVNMQFYAKEMLQNYNDFEQTDRTSRLSAVLFSAIRDNLNNYVQTFMDCVLVLCDNLSTTLRGLITSFTSTYDLDNDVEHWVQFLLRRNNLVYDYLSFDFLNEELYNALLNYNSCITRLSEFIMDELKKKDLLEVKIQK